MPASDSYGRSCGARAVLGLRCQSSGRLIQAFDLLGVCVSSVRVSRGEGVACAVATIIAIGPPPSEKMPKVRTLRKNKWLLDKFSQNDKTRA